MSNNNHNNHEDDDKERMSYEEYLKGEPGYEEVVDDLPAGFLSAENRGSNLNMFLIPEFKYDMELVIDNYVDLISQVKTKSELKMLLLGLFNEAQKVGEIMAKIERFQLEAEIMQVDMESFNKGTEVEILFTDEFTDEDPE